LKVLIVDDSVIFRRVLAEVLSALPGVEVVGQVSNGRLALQKVRELQPDLMTLDLEMPEMDGLAVLDALREDKSTSSVFVVVVSSLTTRGAKLTLSALEKGALDFVTKPETESSEKSREILRTEFAAKVKMLELRKGIREILNRKPTPAVKVVEAVKSEVVNDLTSVPQRMARVSERQKPDLIVIGVSTGGPNALKVLLPSLPANLGVPVLIVQHMPPVFTLSLAESLNQHCALKVVEATDGDSIKANTVYIAPGGFQMKVVPTASHQDGWMLSVNSDPAENNCRPSVDYLFRSVANTFTGQTVAVILTGMGSDGTLGLRLLKRRGNYAIAQDEASCVVYGMPKAAVDAGVVDVVLPLENIASTLTRLVSGGLT
jgi:two-component system chemotaxis response regulator CheB